RRWIPGHRSLALRYRLPGERLDAWELPDSRRRPAAPQPGWHLGLLARGLPAFGSADRRGELGRVGTPCDRQLRLDGRRRLPAGTADDGARRCPPRQPVEPLAGSVVRTARPG